jgi:hypothetical protein
MPTGPGGFRGRRLVPVVGARREKEPGIALEEARARLRVEEVDEAAQSCAACTTTRAESGDATAYCAEHLQKIYGV